MGKLNVGQLVKLKGSGWAGLGHEGEIVTVGDAPTMVADGAFLEPADWDANRADRADRLYYLHGGKSLWGYELVTGEERTYSTGGERTYSTGEIVNAIRSLTEAGVHRELAVKVVSDRVRAGEGL